MVRRRTLLSLGLGAPLLAGAILACGDLKDAPVGGDEAGSPTDAGKSPPSVLLPDGRVVSTGDSSTPPPIAQPDAGPPPNDSVCATHDEWVTATKATAGCADRQVVVVDSVLETNGVSITHTPAGRVAIGFNSEDGMKGGVFHLVHFIPATSPPPAPTIIMRQQDQVTHDGYRARLVGTAPDTVNALTFDYNDEDSTGTVNVATLVNGAAALTDRVLVTAGVASPSEIAYAIDGAGTQYVTTTFATNATTSKLLASTKTTTGAWTALPALVSDLQPKEAAGIGQTSMFLDLNSQLHVLYQRTAGINATEPEYRYLSAGAWSAAEAVDNQTLAGFAGFNPRIVTAGNRKYALFFYRPAPGAAPATADLRLATWLTPDEEPQIEILEQNIPATDANNPHYRAAMGIDQYGLLHVAAILPNDGETSGVLEYLRQAVQGGETKWLLDIVDPAVISGNGDGEVDLVIDEKARPHIAYISGVDGKVRYATRYDR